MPVRVTTRTLMMLVCLLTASVPALGQARPAPTNSRPTTLMVTGTVADETGGILPSARVELLSSDGGVLQTAIADAQGRFQFPAVSPGRYSIRSMFPGLTSAAIAIRVGATRVDSIKLVLHVAAVEEGVVVDSGNNRPGSDSAANLDTIAIDQDMLKELPVLDQDVLGAVSRFLDASATGGGATLVVNGMEVSALRVSPSAIQQIKINQDPYSAEFSRPGRGRIEVLTKPGGQHYSGELNVVGRDARLDARNAFLTTTPNEQKRIAEGNLGGPIGHGGRTSFLGSGSWQRDDQQAIVVATLLDGAIRDQVPQPNSQALVSVGVTRLVGAKTTIALTPSYEFEGADNQGVGGLTLASAGTAFRHHEQQLRYSHQTSLTPNLFFQLQVLVGHERETTTGRSQARGLVVAGAFTGGGAQRDMVRTETHTQLAQSLTWSHNRHTVQAGFQLPDWSRRGFADSTDFGGTFYFDGLASYEAGRPYAFSQQAGNGNLSLLEKQVGAYVKDDWQVRANLSLSAGLRYDWQNYFHDGNNVSPRVSVAYAPHGSTKNVIRSGVGIYSDRSGPVILADLIHSQRGDLQRYVISDPVYPDPGLSPSGAAPRSLTVLAPGVQIPRTLQASVSLDHQIRKGLTTSIGYTGSRGYDQFRSRDINAPRPPLYTTRPDSSVGAIREIESNGRQISHSIQVTVRGQVSPFFNGQTQYTWSRAQNDTNGLNSYPANDYDLASEWGLADFDRRHRLALIGRLTRVPFVDVGVGVTMNSAAPYTAVIAEDIYHNGRGRARPDGVGRNTLVGAGYSQVDLRVAHTFKGQSDDRSYTVSLDAFNVLNRVNYGPFVGTLGSPLFGQPISARPPRQLQLSASFGF